MDSMNGLFFQHLTHTSNSFFSKQQSTSQDEDDEDMDQLDPTGGMPKCPSAPNIHQHKLYQRVPSMLVTPASAGKETRKN